MRLRSLPNCIPEHGLALHGTLYKKAQRIRKTGLQGLGYICPLPPWQAQVFEGIGQREAISRIIGSVLFAQKFGSGEELGRRNLSRGNLPAVVIFRGAKPLGLVGTAPLSDFQRHAVRFGGKGYDDDMVQRRRKPPFKSYISFGKTPVGYISAEQVAAIARVTPAEYLQLRRKVINRIRRMGVAMTRPLLHNHLESEVHSLLTRKTLKLLHEESQKGEARPKPLT
ncbi:MAG: hypothetical protein J4203_01535 [Candidatus Diapherotrites archaeon]|uniref:Uncharacterized protein n=1 Tax=Candidatus Iainarchaeum sp. TaxID=3101447 RepID=A0A8T4L6L7_9ARCH|nr:hypothetical protein [Candidatus Diapherotrites archaeon]